MRPAEENPSPPRRYSDAVLTVIATFSDGWGTCDALNAELTPGLAVAEGVPVWGVAICRSGLITAGVVTITDGGTRYRFDVHQGDRQTAAHWLRTQGVPCLRISTKQPKGNSPIRWNPSFKDKLNV